MDKITKIITFDELVIKLRELGLKQGMIIEVHSSLKKFGYVVGGAQTIIDALIEVVGYNGTIIMPLHCGSNSEPSKWGNPPCEVEDVKLIRENMPAFDKKNSDTYYMGKVVDSFRRRDGVVISSHPSLAYIAWGKYAKLLCNRQSLHFPLSEESSTARLYEMKASCLLLGVDYDNCTCMHLGEYRSDVRPIVIEGASCNDNGQTVWKKYLDLDLDSDDFINVGKVMESKGYVNKIDIGNAICKLFKVDVAVDETVKYFDFNSINKLYKGA